MMFPEDEKDVSKTAVSSEGTAQTTPKPKRFNPLQCGTPGCTCSEMDEDPARRVQKAVIVIVEGRPIVTGTCPDHETPHSLPIPTAFAERRKLRDQLKTEAKAPAAGGGRRDQAPPKKAERQDRPKAQGKPAARQADRRDAKEAKPQRPARADAGQRPAAAAPAGRQGQRSWDYEAATEVANGTFVTKPPSKRMVNGAPVEAHTCSLETCGRIAEGGFLVEDIANPEPKPLCFRHYRGGVVIVQMLVYWRKRGRAEDETAAAQLKALGDRAIWVFKDAQSMEERRRAMAECGADHGPRRDEPRRQQQDRDRRPQPAPAPRREPKREERKAQPAPASDGQAERAADDRFAKAVRKTARSAIVEILGTAEVTTVEGQAVTDIVLRHVEVPTRTWEALSDAIQEAAVGFPGDVRAKLIGAHLVLDEHRKRTLAAQDSPANKGDDGDQP